MSNVSEFKGTKNYVLLASIKKNEKELSKSFKSALEKGAKGEFSDIFNDINEVKL